MFAYSLSDFRHLPFIIILLFAQVYIKSADLAVDYSPIEVLALPLKSNKTTGNLRRYDNAPSIQEDAGNSHTRKHLLLTLILTLNSESC